MCQLLCYVGEIYRHLIIPIREYLKIDKLSQLYKHLSEETQRKSFCTENCSSILDNAVTN